MKETVIVVAAVTLAVTITNQLSNLQVNATEGDCRYVRTPTVTICKK